MTETLHLKDCPVCASRISITHDKIEDSLTLRPENLPPLAKDCLDIISTYKRLKGLGAEWQSKHGSRAIIYARELLTAAGPLGGAVERCQGLLEWLKADGKDFDMGTASSYLMAYSEYLASKAAASRGRCKICSEGYWVNGGANDNCGRH